MKIIKSSICFVICFAIFAASSGPQKTGLKTDPWDVICTIPKIFYMILDIKDTHQGNPILLTIEVAIDKETKNISYFSFEIPDQADKLKGLTIGFADLEKKAGGDRVTKLVQVTTMALPIESCEEGLCLVKIDRGVLATPNSTEKLILLDLFLKHQVVRLVYWVNGRKVTAEASLIGFHKDFPAVLKDLQENHH